ncbi:hypothetical protein ABFT23_00970 [Nocardioides sp. C4-1]|uniref:hypothetical protein n=1 Tax=Nocardioides sp. C4-1 TaxID=3151851 RepID=UPI003263F867
MPRQPSSTQRAAVHGVKLVVAAAVAVLAVAPTVGPTVGPTATADVRVPSAAEIAAQARLDDLMQRHDCSATGFGPDVIPGSALVERDDRIERVSFDEGWAIYTGDRNGSLLAVCRSIL